MNEYVFKLVQIKQLKCLFTAFLVLFLIWKLADIEKIVGILNNKRFGIHDFNYMLYCNSLMKMRRFKFLMFYLCDFQVLCWLMHFKPFLPTVIYGGIS